MLSFLKLSYLPAVCPHNPFYLLSSSNMYYVYFWLQSQSLVYMNTFFAANLPTFKTAAWAGFATNNLALACRYFSPHTAYSLPLTSAKWNVGRPGKVERRFNNSPTSGLILLLRIPKSSLVYKTRLKTLTGFGRYLFIDEKKTTVNSRILNCRHSHHRSRQTSTKNRF